MTRVSRIAGTSLAGCLLLSCIASSSPAAQRAAPAKRPIDYVNALVGTAPLDDPKLIGNAPPAGEQLYSGIVSPGARLPQSSTILAPINVNLQMTYPAGVATTYHYTNPTMLGFSGGSSTGPTLMTMVGDWTVPPQRIGAVYDKAREKASPGYYSMFLDTHQTQVEMTATTWTGLFRFTFPATDRAHIILDLAASGGDVEVVGDTIVRGKAKTLEAFARTGGIDDAYFVAEFSKPFKAFGTFRSEPAEPRPRRFSVLGDKIVEPGQRAMSGDWAGAYLQFATAKGEQVLVKIAHGPSYAVAEQRLRAESPGWNFARVKQQAEAAWADKLGRIEIKGGSEKERALFYSTLFQSLASPRLVARKGEQFVGLDGKTKVAEHDRYGPIPFWDTGRNQIVLLSLLEPEVKGDILRSELDMAREKGFMNTSFHADNAVFMYLGDWERGIDFDHAGVYDYLRKNATDPSGPRNYLAEYVRRGWISDDIPKGNPSPPYADGKAGVAKTLEYSWDDYAMAQYARKLGKDDDYRMFLKRAGNYRNVFDPAIGFMRGRTDDGKWISPFDPGEPYYNFMMKEASGWSTLWLASHDVGGLVNLLGGRDRFAAKLDQFFTTPYAPKGICRDCTGMIGQYVQGNQPDQQVAYYYNWAGQPWKAQELTRRILRVMYGSDKAGVGYPGMDDQGATSSWYVLSAMGFYTVDPSSPNYIIGSPLFDEVTLHMGHGKDFVVEARGNSAKNIYIQSATLNGRPWNKPWFSHADIANGGRLVIQMGPLPNKSWGSAPEAAPPSMSTMQ